MPINMTINTQTRIYMALYLYLICFVTHLEEYYCVWVQCTFCFETNTSGVYWVFVLSIVKSIAEIDQRVWSSRHTLWIDCTILSNDWTSMRKIGDKLPSILSTPIKISLVKKGIDMSKEPRYRHASHISEEHLFPWIKNYNS